MTTKTFFPPWKAVFDDGRIFIYDSNHNVVALLDYKSQTREARELDAALIARAPELLTENEELKKRIDELESEAEVISAEFEGEMWRGVRSILLKDCGWSGDCFPATPDDALQGLQEEMRYRSDEVVRLKARIAQLEAENEDMRSLITVLKIENERLFAETKELRAAIKEEREFKWPF